MVLYIYIKCSGQDNTRFSTRGERSKAGRIFFFFNSAS